jgi:hypothetical protein
VVPHRRLLLGKPSFCGQAQTRRHRPLARRRSLTQIILQSPRSLEVDRRRHVWALHRQSSLCFVRESLVAADNPRNATDKTRDLRALLFCYIRA